MMGTKKMNWNGIARITSTVCVALAVGQTAHAGYPVVTQIGDTLYIDGDNTSNSVTIVGASGDEFEDPDAGETQGVVAVYIKPDPWIYEGIVHLEVDLAGGDNVLKMARLDIAGNVTVTTGDGDNIVVLDGFQTYGQSFIDGEFNVTTGNGVDRIWMDNALIYDDVTINTAGGQDWVKIGKAYSQLIADVGVGIDGNLSVTTGADDDNVNVRCTVLIEAFIDTDAGEDFVLLGLPHYEVGGVMDAPVRNSDPDDFRSNDNETRPDAGKALASNRTDAYFPRNMFIRLFVYTGTESDDVILHDNLIGMETQIELDDGSDGLYIFAPNEFYKNFTAHGGAGDVDVLVNEPENFYENTPTFNSF